MWDMIIPPLITGGLNFLGGIGQSKIQNDAMKRQEQLTRDQMAQQRMFGAYDRASDQAWSRYGAEAQNVQRDNFSAMAINTIAGLMLGTGQTPSNLVPLRQRPNTPTAQGLENSAASMFGGQQPRSRGR